MRFPVAHRVLHRDAIRGFGYLRHLGLRLDGNALVLERLLELGGNLFVLQRHGARQHFQHRHLGPEAREDGGEFHAHRSRADHHHRFRNRRQAQNLFVGEKRFAVRLEARQHARFRARGQHDILRRNFLRAPFGIGHADFAGAGNFAEAANHFDLVLFEQEFHALRQLGNNLRFARQDRLPIKGELFRDNAEFFGILEVI